MKITGVIIPTEEYERLKDIERALRSNEKVVLLEKKNFEETNYTFDYQVRDISGKGGIIKEMALKINDLQQEKERLMAENFKMKDLKYESIKSKWYYKLILWFN